MQAVSSVLAAGGGFLLAVLWMDLMFDVQVLPFRRQGIELPESVLTSIATYYRRVTTSARPMGHLIAVVMLVVAAMLVTQLIFDQERRGLALVSLPFGFGPILLACLRVYPNAVRLGSRPGTAIEQSTLARSICRDHLLCFVGILTLIVLQILAA